MTDALDVLREQRPEAAGPRPALVDASRKALMQTITAPPPTLDPRPSKGRRFRRRFIPAAVLVGVVGTAAAYGLLSSDPRTTTAVQCAASTDGTKDASVIPSSSGDPIQDCSAWWQRTYGQPAPRLTAFDNGHGGVLVLPAGGPAPEGSKPLAEGFRQDDRLIQLDHELGDVTRGITGAGGMCRSYADAASVARRQLERLALSDWTVASERGKPDGSRSCAMAIVDPQGRRVVVVPQERVTLAPGSDLSAQREDEAIVGRIAEFARAVDGAMVEGPAARCLSASDALAAVGREAARAGLSEQAGTVQVNPSYPSGPGPDGTSRCVRPAVDVGGTVFVHLHSVSRESFDRSR